MLQVKQIDEIQKRLLAEIADLHDIPEGAFNIRANGEMAARNTTANIDIVSKEDGTGIDIHIKPGTKNESVHIPVVMNQSGLGFRARRYSPLLHRKECQSEIRGEALRFR